MDDLATLGEPARRRLCHRLTRECEAMAQHAFSTGLTVPIEVMELLNQAFWLLDTQAARLPTPAAPGRDASEADALPPGVPALAALSRAHTALAAIITPATPEAILLISDERIKHPLITAFGPVPIARQMLGLALVSLLVLLVVSLSALVNEQNMVKTVLELSGIPLLMVEVFLLSAASLGSCFANLQRISRFVSNGTYDPKSQSTYWTRWVMGIISGIILSQLIYDLFVPTPYGVVGQPLLALLGGYSVDVVQTIINRIINAVSSVFQSPEDGSSGGQRSLVDDNRSIQSRRNAATSIAAGHPVDALPAMNGRSRSPPQLGEQDIAP
jgi:hypothetical protein